MNRTLGIVLIVWNVILTALLGWSVSCNKVSAGSNGSPDETSVVVSSRDSTDLKDARIAFFFIDSLREHLDLMKERGAHYKNEAQRLSDQWDKELGKAQAEAQALGQKDPTYSTKAEMEADQRHMDELQQKIGELKQNSEVRMQQLEMDILAEVSSQIEAFLKEYNATAKYDYIISVEPGGQIWVGNQDLDISEDMIAGMNAQYKAKKDVAADKLK